MKALAGALAQSVRGRLRRLLEVDSQSLVTPLAGLAHLGSETHGYRIPEGLLGPGSICYCVGAGEDITFDTELAERFGCHVFVIDPTPEARNHFELVNDRIRSGVPLWSSNGTPYRYRISPQRLSLLRYVDIGVWDRATRMRFYEPLLQNYPSRSVSLFQDSGRFIELPVDRLASIMRSHGHQHIDLLKLEIEGAEYRVIETIVEDAVDVKAILVEYDEVYHSEGKGRAHLFRIRDSTRRLLKAGYRLVHSTPMFKRLFVREDSFDVRGIAAVVAAPDAQKQANPGTAA